MEEFKDKFVGFVDILGFKKLVTDSEAGTGLSLSELVALAKCLGTGKERARFELHGPKCCPKAPCMERNLDFRVTQLSDCVIVSSEISPAGAINLVAHCWDAVIELMSRGILCRGYIKRGQIFHSESQVIGTGYQDAYLRESEVNAFKREADERGTPYVEVDAEVTTFIETQPDECVKMMFGRMTKRDGDVAVLFPFQALAHTFVVAGLDHQFDPDKDLASNRALRSGLQRMKERTWTFVDRSNSRAVRKVEHYLAALDAQVENCDETERVIRIFSSK